MFNRLFSTLKHSISRESLNSSPASSDPIVDTQLEQLTPDPDMVTTRRGNDTASPAVAKTEKRTGRKRALRDELEIRTSSSKRRKASPEQIESLTSPLEDKSIGVAEEKQTTQAVPEVAVEDTQRHNGTAAEAVSAEESDTVVIADSQPTPKPESRANPMRSFQRQRSPKVLIDSSYKPSRDIQVVDEIPSSSQDFESVYGTPDVLATPSVYATPATTLRGQASSSKKRAPVEASSDGSELLTSPVQASAIYRGQHAEVPSDEGEHDEDVETPKASKKQLTKSPKKLGSSPSPNTSLPARSHIRFGSAEPSIPSSTYSPSKADLLSGEQADAEPAGDEEGESSSDDEAPEAVAISAGRKQAKAQSEAAQRAVESQTAALKAKRRAIEARLQDQASTKPKKSLPEPILSTSDNGADSDVSEDEAEQVATKSTKFKSTGPLPDLLPAELLATERPPTPTLTLTKSVTDQPQKSNKVIKFDDLTAKLEKKPKDIRKGPVSVSVLGKSNTLLPPKVSNKSKNVREAFLHRRRKIPSGKKRDFVQNGSFRKVGSGSGGFLRR